MITDDDLRRRLADPTSGSPSDRDFDRLYPHHVRELSTAFWTPVRVAQRAVALLAASPATRVLDVGSGVGKFCIVAGLACGAEVRGIEQRGDLVAIASAAAARLRAPARFVRGSIVDVEWAEFDAFYFYNPFFENVHRDNHIDEAVELSAERFAADVRATLAGLDRARIGARVVTYHGLGGPLPPGYRLLTKEAAGSDMLELWVNIGAAAAANHEGGGEVPPAPPSHVRGIS